MTGRRGLWPDVRHGFALAAVLSLVLLACLITVSRAGFHPAPAGPAVPDRALLATVPVDASRLRPGDLVLLTTPDGPAARWVLSVEPAGVRTADWVLEKSGRAARVVSVIPHGADPALWFGVAVALPPLTLLVVAVVLAARHRRRHPLPDTPLSIMTPR